jgi:hypothetical protein
VGDALGGGDALGRGERDALPRMDAELLAAGVRPGHPSLYESPDSPDAPFENGEHHHHEHDAHEH